MIYYRNVPAIKRENNVGGKRTILLSSGIIYYGLAHYIMFMYHLVLFDKFSAPLFLRLLSSRPLSFSVSLCHQVMLYVINPTHNLSIKPSDKVCAPSH